MGNFTTHMVGFLENEHNLTIQTWRCRDNRRSCYLCFPKNKCQVELLVCTHVIPPVRQMLELLKVAINRLEIFSSLKECFVQLT